MEEADTKADDFIPSGTRDLASIPAAELEAAYHRRVILEEFLLLPKGGMEVVDAYAQRLQVSRATFYRLLKRYRRNPTVTSLLAAPTGPKKGVTWLDEKIEDVIAEAIRTYYLTSQILTPTAVYDRIKVVCSERGLPVPAKNTVVSRIRALPRMEAMVAREGRKAAREKLGPVRGHVPVGQYSLDLFQIDHTRGDVIIVDEKSRKPIGRPLLTLTVDTYSRAIAGFFLSLDDAPSSVQVGLSLYHAVLPKESYLRELGIEASWPIYGLCNSVLVDNGTDLRSRAFVSGCHAHGIGVMYRPVARPSYGGLIERAIGKVGEFLKTVPGATWSNPLQRGDYRSEDKAVLTLRELEAILTIYCAEIHNKQPHSATNRVPEAMFREGLRTYPEGVGQGRGRLPVDLQRFYIDFLPFQYRKLQRTGIRINNLDYTCDALGPLIAQQKSEPMLVRYDPRDISHIYLDFPDGSGYQRVPAMQLDLPSIDLGTARRLRQEQIKLGRAESDPRAFARGLRQQEEIVRQAAQETKAQRRLRARKTDGVLVQRRPAPPSERPPALPEMKDHSQTQETVPQKVEVFDDAEFW